MTPRLLRLRAERHATLAAIRTALPAQRAVNLRCRVSKPYWNRVCMRFEHDRRALHRSAGERRQEREPVLLVTRRNPVQNEGDCADEGVDGEFARGVCAGD